MLAHAAIICSVSSLVVVLISARTFSLNLDLILVKKKKSTKEGISKENVQHLDSTVEQTFICDTLIR